MSEYEQAVQHVDFAIKYQESKYEQKFSEDRRQEILAYEAKRVLDGEPSLIERFKITLGNMVAEEKWSPWKIRQMRRQFVTDIQKALIEMKEKGYLGDFDVKCDNEILKVVYYNVFSHEFDQVEQRISRESL